MAIKLKPDEEAWLNEYRRALEEKYPGMVEDIVIFRSDEAQSYVPDYAINTVVVLQECDRRTRKDIERLGYHSAGLSDAMPFVSGLIDQSEWKQRRSDGSLPYLGDGTPVWSNKS